MKNSFKAMGLSLMMVSPLALSQPAFAQEHADSAQRSPHPITGTATVDGNDVKELQGAGLVAQRSDTDREIRAFGNSKYDYWDARVLASFWGSDVMDTKATMGRKLMWGGENKAYLEQQVLDARVKALGSVEDLKLYSDAGYSYQDTEALSRLWGDPSPYDSKLRIERNLIMGNQDAVTSALSMAKKR